MAETPKIVQIETRYVETDAVNFRYVVQSLTGKNSSIDWIGSDIKSAEERIPDRNNTGAAAAAATNGTNETLLPSSSSSMQMNSNVSFKDFDGFTFPPMDMMPWSSYSYT